MRDPLRPRRVDGGCRQQALAGWFGLDVMVRVRVRVRVRVPGGRQDSRKCAQ
ncbi:hypothetical protein [Streptomyces sp. NPDC051677]|uniref:hypothetical protein n=1 Tax=Streptomyces sp. NPDC051677 TaxID=3365669 RepID=UPI0037D87817